MSELSQALLPLFPLRLWSQQRRENYDFVAAALDEIEEFQLLRPAKGATTPFCVTLRFISQSHREKLRQALIEQAIYPAVLWSLEDPVPHLEIPAHHLELSRCLLSLHCDMRYTPQDLERVVAVLRRTAASGQGS